MEDRNHDVRRSEKSHCPVDTQIKPLFLERMACADHVAAAKAENGSDVFVPDGRMRSF